MPGEKIVLLPHQSFPAWVFVGRPSAAGMSFELEPTLIILIHGLEERPRLGGMDQHRNFQSSAGFKHVVEARIVHVNALSLGVLQIHAESLEDFQTLRAIA